MQESPCRPLIPLRRSHLDSDTYRTVLRILSHCVELEPPIALPSPRLCPSLPGTREQDCPASSVGGTTLCAIPGEDGCGLDEVGDGNGGEGHGEGAGRDFSEEEGDRGRGKLQDVLASVIPGLGDAHVEDSPPAEDSGPHEVRGGVCDDSPNGVSPKEQFDSLADFLADFSRLVEEVDLQEEEEGRDAPDSDGLKNKLTLEEIESLGSCEACPQVNAPEHQAKSHRGTRVDESNVNESPGDELPTELVCRDLELLSVPAGNVSSVEESCMETHLKFCDSSGPPNGAGELGEHDKIISACPLEENEVEEGEIPNDGEISGLSFGLESQDVTNGRIQLEERDPADDVAEKRNMTVMFAGAGLTKAEKGSVVHESGQLVTRRGLKPEKKIKSTKGAKKSAGKTGKKVDLSNKPPKNEMKLECQKNMKNAAAATTKDAISENTVSGGLSVAEVSFKDSAIQNEEKPSNVVDDKAQQKRKRAPPTENRKEKKKLAKKRKRAETNRKLGVKRLKLEMSSKPRKVIPCSFYQKGRCHKGDSCKFSHDIIPDTKSMPCTFFARGTCLKGDDCPFDHQLSKYPCHNYVSQGRCIRGDSCLFSHKIPAGELSSTRSVTSEIDSAMLSGKQSTQKCLNSSNLPSAVDLTLEVPTTSAKSSMSKDLIEQMKLKQPARMPKGICFLSFGKEPSHGLNKPHHDLDLKKGGSIQLQKQGEKLILGKGPNSNEILFSSPEKSLPCRTFTSLANEDKSLSLLQKPPCLVQHNVEVKSCESVQPLSSNTTRNGSKDVTNEESTVTDASRILEEFLFSAIA